MPIIDFTAAAAKRYDLCIVGSGPAGMAVALDCAAAGLSTLVLESGGLQVAEGAVHGHDAVLVDPNRHAPLEKVACRAFGGTSHWWGGLCNTYQEHEITTGNWPITYDELSRWYPDAARFLGCGPSFDNAAPFAAQGGRDVMLGGLSRLSSHARELAAGWLDQVAALPALHVVLGAEAVGLARGADGTITAVRARVADAEPQPFAADAFVLAAGGLGTTRLLLAEQARGAPFTGCAHLGRNYMGHLTGTFVRVRLQGATVDVNAVLADDLLRERLIVGPGAPDAPHTTAFWVGNVPLWNADHHSGAKSAKYLVGRLLRAVRKMGASEALDARLGLQHVPLKPHFANIAHHPTEALTAVLTVVRKIVQRGLQRHPDLPEPDRDGTYALWYHAEQSPSAANTVLAEGRTNDDALPPVTIRFGFEERDVENVVRAHQRLKATLDELDTGMRIEPFDPASLARRVRKAAYDGYHQIGTTRMGLTADTGFVDRDCRVFGTPNLYLASAGVFPSSGQPNPTLTIVALAKRLAAHLSAASIVADRGV